MSNSKRSLKEILDSEYVEDSEEGEDLNLNDNLSVEDDEDSQYDSNLCNECKDMQAEIICNDCEENF